MKLSVKSCLVIVGLEIFAGPGTTWATAPYTEDFTSDVANWGDGPGTGLVSFAPSGGPDGSSYASTTATGFNAADGSRIVLFRGQNNFNSSNHAFEGDWLGSGIVRFSDYVWHNAPVALPFWVRFATPGNFPAVGGDNGVLVQPQTWTQLNYDILASQINVTLFPEGPPSFFGQTFANVGRIQIGYAVPTGFGADPNTYTFGLDQVAIAIPEPASWTTAIGLLAVGWGRRRRPELA